MTTVIRTRIPLESLNMSQSTGRRRSKRIAETYDEEDDGFMFTRASKRTKTAPPKPEPAPATTTPAPATAKRGRKPKEPKPRDDEVTATEKKPSGRRMSFSTPKAEPETAAIPKKRKTTRSSTGKAGNATEAPNASRTRVASEDRTDRDEHIPEAENQANGTRNGTIISLPFSDTPIINRNKEMRKKGGNGVRRSSLGLRGRRASSLIDSGHTAIPHREVETSEFYKHIEGSLAEPRRMKQLLTWTGERCLGSAGEEKELELGDPNRAAAKAELLIKESLLKDFGNKAQFSNWFSRDETAPLPTKVVKTPNPRNIEMAQKVEALEERVKSLRIQRDQWKALAKIPPALPPMPIDERIELTPADINPSLLDPEQAAILEELKSSSALDIRAQATQRLQTLLSGLEFKVDQFADGVHKLEQYQETVGRVADKILALSAVRLEERDRKEREEIGTRDVPMQEVLRSLSRILPESSSQR